ncbi:TraR/DksA family transcriptional regulator [Microlunatus parietis]
MSTTKKSSAKKTPSKDGRASGSAPARSARSSKTAASSAPKAASREGSRSKRDDTTPSTPAVQKRAAKSAAKPTTKKTGTTKRSTSKTPAAKRSAATGRTSKRTGTRSRQAPASKRSDTDRTTSTTNPADTALTPRSDPMTSEAAPAATVKPVKPSSLPVREGEDPWTKAELDEVRETLESDIERFTAQLAASNAELVGMLRDGAEGAGRDPADVGSANFERDAEMSLVNNAAEMLEQSRLALRHIDQGIYGSCDNCGNPIGKGRLLAFPRATLCVTCKQREERR